MISEGNTGRDYDVSIGSYCAKFARWVGKTAALIGILYIGEGNIEDIGERYNTKAYRLPNPNK